MKVLSLNGTDWTLLDPQTSQTCPATVPGCVHTDLLAADRIPDPWYRDNEKEIHWVCLQDWTYTRTFDVDEALLEHDHLTLCCEGLDTLAEVVINDQCVLNADNMFRTWQTEVRSALKLGKNRIEVRFTSPIPEMQRLDAERRLPGWNIFHEDFFGKSYIRKMGCAFGWDWGLMAPTAGIWRDITLRAWHTRLADIQHTQQHDPAGPVTIHTRITTEGRPGASVRVRIEKDGSPITIADSSINESEVIISQTIENPALWWPAGLGEQPLYEVTTELLDADGQVIERQSHRLGLRTLELIREADEFGESFRFRCNGLDFFAKGANWIPCDVFPSRIADETYRDLLTSAAESGMNMIRLWGGGIYEQPAFYDRCDELGLLIWHDFMFACSTYPWWDEAFLENVRHEAIDNIRRVRHHPSLALWCGNNEIEQGLSSNWLDPDYIKMADYEQLFDQLLPELVAAHDGVTPYWPSSSHTPAADQKERLHYNDPTRGDAHAWSVWFGGQPFESQRSWVFRFMSEFGFQSFPEPRTIASFTLPEDRDLASWVMDYHQRSGPGNQTIFKYLIEWFPMPANFDQLTWLSQLTQALCIQYAAEHARRIQGRMDGLLYWQLNDLWPGATWASIDVFGRWKALQYFAKRFFAPALISLLENHETSSVALHVSNHHPTPLHATAHWMLTDAAGQLLDRGEQPCEIPPQSNRQLLTLDCTDARRRSGTARLPLEIRNAPDAPIAGDRDLLIWAWLTDPAGLELSRNLAFFAKPKYLLLQPPTITTEITTHPIEANTYLAALTTTHASPWTRLELQGHDARFSDNFLHLTPDLPTIVTITPQEPMTLQEIKDQFRVMPLLDYSQPS